MQLYKLLQLLKNDIDEFVGEAPQFDDITMLIIDYKPQEGGNRMVSKKFLATIETLPEVISFVEETLESYECSMKNQSAICIAIEEVFVNIANYAYKDDVGNVSIRVSFNEDTREVTFCISDKGIPFNPLAKSDPDITLSLEEREIGGLGIFITKKTMDKVKYAFENEENVLTIIKKI